MIREGALSLAVLAGLVAVVAAGAEVRPAVAQSAPGCFEVSALDPVEAQWIASLAEEAWRHLERPLGLPPAFSSPVFVRRLPAEPGREGRSSIELNVEPGGVVSVWIWGGGPVEPLVRRALVRGLLSRLAVSWQGGGVPPTVPLWLEHGCVGWWETRARAAQLDAMKQRAQAQAPPAIAALLEWRESQGEPPGFAAAAVWLFTFLQSEAGKEGEWAALLRRLFSGVDPQAALAMSYPGRYHGGQARELWWQTGWHHARRVRVLPVLEAAESRERLAELMRFVFASPAGEGDEVLPLWAVLRRTSEPIVKAELTRRAAEVQRLLPTVHPFYRNAALSLAEVLTIKGDEPKVLFPRAKKPPLAGFEQDWQDARELERAAQAGLDALEQATPPRGSGGPG